MARRSSPGFGTGYPNASGFTLIEALISVTIMALLSLFVVADLRTSAQQEQLISAQRVIAADLRSAQARALAAQNVKTCPSAGHTIVCELSSTSCDVPNACLPSPPFSVGIRFSSGVSTYTLFSDVDPAYKDWMDTPGASEEFQVRDLATEGAPNVVIDSLRVPAIVPTANVAFERQNGNAHINPCAASPCVESSTIVIQLRQTQTGNVKTVLLDASTGRVSLD